MFHVSVSGMVQWEARYDAGRRAAGTKFRGVTNKGALNVKLGWQRRWRNLSHAPMLADAISYDLTSRGMGEHSAEIGPDKTRPQGALGNLIEFGSVNNPPHPGGLPAAIREEPRFVDAVADAGEEAAGG
jgi:hypothetical protein